MTFEITTQGEQEVALLKGEGVLVSSPQDMLDMIATVNYQHGCTRLVIKKENLVEDFFNLKTGIAGEMLQKVINYNASLAIVGDFSVYASKALQDFIYESNKGKRIFFLPGVEAAVKKLQTDADV